MDADVLALAEVDCLEIFDQKNKLRQPAKNRKEASELIDFLRKDMGYDYQLAERSNGLKASAVFFKKDKFNCIKKGFVDLDDQPMAYPMVYCHLEEKNSALKLIVAEAHLKGLSGPVDQVMRFNQATKLKEFFQSNYVDVPVILCGDFNDVPGSRPLKLIEEDFMDLFHLSTEKEGEKVKAMKHPDFTLIK